MEQLTKEQEENFQFIIERTSEECKEDNDTFFYLEVLRELAPYIFPSTNAVQARTQMLQALSKAKHRGPVNGGRAR